MELESNGSPINQIESIIMLEKFIRNTLHASFTHYVFNRGICFRRCNQSNIIESIVLRYLEELASVMLSQKQKVFSRLEQNFKCNIGITGDPINVEKESKDKAIQLFKHFKHNSTPLNYLTEQQCNCVNIICKSMFPPDLCVKDIDGLVTIAEILGVTIKILYSSSRNKIIESDLLNNGCFIQLTIQQIKESEYAILYDRNVIINEQIYDDIKVKMNKYIQHNKDTRQLDQDTHKLISDFYNQREKELRLFHSIEVCNDEIKKAPSISKHNEKAMLETKFYDEQNNTSCFLDKFHTYMFKKYLEYKGNDEYTKEFIYENIAISYDPSFRYSPMLMYLLFPNINPLLIKERILLKNQLNHHRQGTTTWVGILYGYLEIY